MGNSVHFQIFSNFDGGEHFWPRYIRETIRRKAFKQSSANKSSPLDKQYAASNKKRNELLEAWCVRAGSLTSAAPLANRSATVILGSHSHTMSCRATAPAAIPAYWKARETTDAQDSRGPAVELSCASQPRARDDDMDGFCPAPTLTLKTTDTLVSSNSTHLCCKHFRTW